jgi:type II secretory pathway pseudopilin PulG
VSAGAAANSSSSSSRSVSKGHGSGSGQRTVDARGSVYSAPHASYLPTSSAEDEAQQQQQQQQQQQYHQQQQQQQQQQSSYQELAHSDEGVAFSIAPPSLYEHDLDRAQHAVDHEKDDQQQPRRGSQYQLSLHPTAFNPNRASTSSNAAIVSLRGIDTMADLTSACTSARRNE